MQFNKYTHTHTHTVCVFSSHSFWTSSSLDVPAGVTQEEGDTGFFIPLLSAVRALIFLARRIQPFLSLVDREVEFCVLTIYSFSTRWAFFVLFFSLLVRKIPFAGVELTSQRVRGLQGTSKLPGRPAAHYVVSMGKAFTITGAFYHRVGISKSTQNDVAFHLQSCSRN